MKTSTENINALNDLAEAETLELNFHPMSELGEWKDVHGFPNYQINNEGAFMNKRTLKMLKHFLHKDSAEASRAGSPEKTTAIPKAYDAIKSAAGVDMKAKGNKY